jgi:hypothetical protein
MAAEDNLSQQLFHGTSAELKPGDIVAPRHGEAHAWATTRHDVAESYGYAATKTPKHLTREESKTWQRPLFGSVYEVEPVDAEESKHSTENYKDADGGLGASVRVSTKGFRVKGLKSLATKPHGWMD